MFEPCAATSGRCGSAIRPRARRSRCCSAIPASTRWRSTASPTGSGGAAGPCPARFLSHVARFLTGIEIHPAARLGPGLFIDHGMGIVIGETAEVGENVSLLQGVTLGGTSRKREKRHPTLGDNVVVGAGAKIIGAFKIGDGSRIGAGSVVVREVPPNSVVVGVPGRVTYRDGTGSRRIDLTDRSPTGEQGHRPDSARTAQVSRTSRNRGGLA